VIIMIMQPQFLRRTRRALPLVDLSPPADDLLQDALAGLTQPAKTLPCKYFYDDRGSDLFDQICGLPEYYPTRTELAISRQHATAMATACGPQVRLLELGSGTSTKTRVLLDHLRSPAAYLPVDIARDFLRASADAIAAAYPTLPVQPVCADFTRPLAELTDHIIRIALPGRRTIVYFPGSTIGNFVPTDATALLANIAGLLGDDGGLLIGVDLQKDIGVLERAYNDSQGVTAAFNKNLLVRLNRELGADFAVDQFTHRAVYDRDHGRIEMRLLSRRRQTVHIADHTIEFTLGEAIVSEHSHKYTLEGFAELASNAGLRVRQVWTDNDKLFSVQYLTPAS
jgi:dimethylhistidine N-methyltransferase